MFGKLSEKDRFPFSFPFYQRDYRRYCRKKTLTDKNVLYYIIFTIAKTTIVENEITFGIVNL